MAIRAPEALWPIVDILLGVLALRCQQLPVPPVAISRVALPRTAPLDPAPWLQLFTVMPEFGAVRGTLVIDAALLGRPLRTADEAVRQALGSAYAETVVD